MTIALNLPPDIEHAYAAAARARGVELADLVMDAVVCGAPQSGADSELLSAEEWVREFRAWAESHAGRNLQVLSDEAMSRESIYADRGL